MIWLNNITKQEVGMSTKYQATDITQAYFITTTTVGWVDIFTRLNQKYIIIDALRYCQKNKGLEIYAYCLTRQRGFAIRADNE